MKPTTSDRVPSQVFVKNGDHKYLFVVVVDPSIFVLSFTRFLVISTRPATASNLFLCVNIVFVWIKCCIMCILERQWFDFGSQVLYMYNKKVKENAVLWYSKVDQFRLGSFVIHSL